MNIHLLQNSPKEISPIKYSIYVGGVRTTFSTTTRIDIDKLTHYLETNITKEVQPQILHEILQRIHKHSKHDDVAILNSYFVQFMDILIPLIDKYEREKHSPPFTQMEVQSTDESNSNQLNHNSSQFHYIFKTPARSKETIFDKHWKEHFQELAEFKRRFGHCNAARTTPGYDQLGNWLADQRKKLRRGKMTREQHDMLTELGK